jgi:hypothetical protein
LGGKNSKLKVVGVQFRISLISMKASYLPPGIGHWVENV